jgi:hypothetical protein
MAQLTGRKMMVQHQRGTELPVIRGIHVALWVLVMEALFVGRMEKNAQLIKIIVMDIVKHPVVLVTGTVIAIRLIMKNV